MASIARTPGTVPAVEMRNITKRFPGVLANKDASLVVRKGQVHALLGENGAGKSTLMNVLAGLYLPDAGEIYIHGEPGHLTSPRHAFDRGIAMVHQHFKLVMNQTVAENIILGLPKPRFHLDMDRVRARILELSRQYEMRVDPDAYVWQLSVGEQQRIEILKALYRGADILILDEPTAVLTPQEADALGETMAKIVGEGKTIIFISHKLNEVIRFADEVTVLRKGEVVAAEPITTDTSTSHLATLMIGRSVVFTVDREPHEVGDVCLEVSGLSALNEKGLPALRDLSFSVRSGQIFGIAGVAGNGQKELAEVLAGLRQATAGSFHLQGRDLTNAHPRRIITAGIAYIPEDRVHVGTVGTMDIVGNIALKHYRSIQGLFLDQRRMRALSENLVRDYNVDTPNVDTDAGKLSGGNLQKLILARELSGDPTLIIASHPTQGLDVGAAEDVRYRLLEQQKRGVAVLLISEDLDELFSLADTIGVLYEGRLMGVVDGPTADRDEVGQLMTGKTAAM